MSPVAMRFISYDFLIPSKWLNNAKYGERPILRRERPFGLSQRDYWRACELQSVDGYMNIALEKTEEYVNGHLQRNYGDAFVRGNNGLSIYFI
ncbi:hypothetical protein PENANT_c020G05381 [Penicillium antarcticum]|uniref:U6 snRNA-associated Sm-like protein LSm6 n=1 Tax=Penicillium antarcticum TaxID=416450 RepID=A0A1V6Q1R6_9EURO|nr:hypothetical protein PENANT_c020G05381 [Penicillium antarcticum]